jgi:SnoaL-like domain
MGVDAVTAEDAVRAYFTAYSEGRPERFEELVSPDYIDYGHTPPGRGPRGARDDYEHAIELAGGVIQYDIDALVAREDSVAVAWTGHLPNGSDFHGLGLYRVDDGRVAEVRRAPIGPPPVPKGFSRRPASSSGR